MSLSQHLRTTIGTLILLWSSLVSHLGVFGLQIVLPGGTGTIGQTLCTKLANNHHDVIVLTRNAFLAAAPSRVSNDFGWMGKSFLQNNPHVKLRDWDGGDLLDIVGQDWVGWQDDVLKNTQDDNIVIVHLVGGGFTPQRTMAYERMVREAMVNCPNALHITVNPIDEEIAVLSPGMLTVKKQRIQECEQMVQQNCRNHECLRIEVYRIEQGCDAIVKAIQDWEKEQS